MNTSENTNIKNITNKRYVLPENYKLLGKERKLMNDTFYITYVLLLTTATVCFIESVRTNDIKIRNILNLEVCISVVAAYFYSLFVEKIDKGVKNNEPVDYRKINITRYTDWSITTPIMLLVLVLALLYNTGGYLKISQYLIILVLNFGMLYSGYYGEVNKKYKLQSVGIGFIFFFLLFGYIYYEFMLGKYHFDNVLIFVAFFIFWAMYGLLYILDEEHEEEKNTGYNILDLFSKCFVGIFFWAYFTKIFVLS